MTGSSQKSDAIEYLKQKYTLQLLVAFRMVYFLLFHLSENEDFLDSLQKKFYNNDDHWSAQSVDKRMQLKKKNPTMQLFFQMRNNFVLSLFYFRR